MQTAQARAHVTTDATIRHAIEFLTLSESESALVFALVHDTEFRLAGALLTPLWEENSSSSSSNPSSSAKTMGGLLSLDVVRALLQVFDSYEDQLRRFVALLMLREMTATANWSELFRANSAITALLREYTCELGADFLHAAFHDTLQALWAEGDDEAGSYEVNPRLLLQEELALPSSEALTEEQRQTRVNTRLLANQQRLEALATRLLDGVLSAAHLFPYQIAKIYRVMEAQMTRLLERGGPDVPDHGARKSTASSMPRLSSISEELALELDLLGGERKSSLSLSLLSQSLPRPSALGVDSMPLAPSSSPRSSSSSPSSPPPPPSTPSSPPPSSPVSAAKEEFYVHLGGFVFLRFLCPALLMPHRVGLGDAPPGRRHQRALVLVAKLFQSLANNVEYGAREEFMAPFNGFLRSHRARLRAFYDQIGARAQHDSRRDSLIARSNLAPRISQLWAPGAGRALSGTAFGFVGERPRLSSLDDALAVLQSWLRAHAEGVARTVARNGTQHALVPSLSRGQGPASTQTQGASKSKSHHKGKGSSKGKGTRKGSGSGRENPARPHKGRVRTRTRTRMRTRTRPQPRVLKSQATTRPQLPEEDDGDETKSEDPISQDEDDDDDGDDDDADGDWDDEEEDTDGHDAEGHDTEGHVPRASDDLEPKRHGAQRQTPVATSSDTGSVTSSELASVMGRTTHRDIQLMKLYYAKLSLNGLQRLLTVNDMAQRADWVPHKRRGDVPVFRRHRATSPRNSAAQILIMPASPTSTKAKTKKKRFVEMKARVQVRLPPAQVFAALKSLDAIAEWGAASSTGSGSGTGSTLRRVEPLDDGRVVLYRSFRQLSRWPAWLVKPRDSCELLSFVAKTGRRDTFAVVMESVPRPDVPELRGTVRMAFATGGFLIEPHDGGAATTLTCVVKADFKGRMPRFLAERVCMRHVLSVRAIRQRLEATTTTTTATSTSS